MKATNGKYTLNLLCSLLATMVPAAALAQNSEPPVQDPNIPSPMAPQTYDAPPGYGEPQPQPQPQPYGQQPQQQQTYPAPTASQPVYVPPQQQQYAPTRGRLVRERYREGDPVPPGARVFSRRKTGLIISGAVLFGVTYLLSGALVVAIDRDLDFGGGVDYTPLVPVFGPLISSSRDNGSYEGLTGLAILSMMGQAAGLTMFAFGLVKRQYIEYYFASRGGRRFGVRPEFAMTRGGSTLGASLTF